MKIHFVVLAGIALLLADATPVLSQTTGVRPLPGGLFAGSDKRRVKQKLEISFSVVEANDSDVPAEATGVLPTDALLSGYSTLLAANMDYGWQGSRVQFRATGASAMRYYSDIESVQSASYSVGIGASARLGGRTTLFANQSVAYLPSYLNAVFPQQAVTEPGTAAPPAPNYAVSDTETYSYGTTVTSTRGLSRRSHVSATGDFQYTDFVHETSARPDLRSGGVRGEYSRNLSRNLALHGGYRYRSGTFAYGGAFALANLSTTEHGPDVGVAYIRPVSETRRLSLGFTTGGSALSVPGRTSRIRCIHTARSPPSGSSAQPGRFAGRAEEQCNTSRGSYAGLCRFCGRRALRPPASAVERRRVGRVFERRLRTE